MALHVILGGNPVDGTEVFGPFKQPEQAIDWADAECPYDDWFLMVLNEPVKKDEVF